MIYEDSLRGPETPSFPLYLELRIIEDCDLRCKYCYAQPFDGTLMQMQDFKRIIDESKRFGVFDLCLAGGEPMLHPNFIDMLDYAISGDYSIDILTNGTLISHSVARKLRRIQEKSDKTLNIQVSLDSIREEVNDSVRGGTKLVKKGIENLLAEGIMPAIAMVVTNQNAKLVTELINYYSAKIRVFNVLPLMRSCEEAKNEKEIAGCNYYEMTEELKNAINEVISKKTKITMSVLEDRGAFVERLEKWNRRCCAGELQAVVKGNLDVISCDMAPNTVLGNLKSSSLREIWNSQNMKELRRGPFPCTLNKIKVN